VESSWSTGSRGPAGDVGFQGLRRVGGDGLGRGRNGHLVVLPLFERSKRHRTVFGAELPALDGDVWELSRD
jgi:hypothetical protein